MVKGKNCEILECASGEKKCPRHKRPGKKSRQRYYKKLAARGELEESRSTIPTAAPAIAPTIESTDVAPALVYDGGQSYRKRAASDPLPGDRAQKMPKNIVYMWPPQRTELGSEPAKDGPQHPVCRSPAQEQG